jgi:hypothetical protein
MKDGRKQNGDAGKGRPGRFAPVRGSQCGDGAKQQRRPSGRHTSPGECRRRPAGRRQQNGHGKMGLIGPPWVEQRHAECCQGRGEEGGAGYLDQPL